MRRLILSHGYLYQIWNQAIQTNCWNSDGTNCAHLVADLFSYSYERDFIDFLNHGNQADVIEAFNSTSRYLDSPYFEGMVNQINPPELQLNKANTAGTETPF